jgi:hypothetical protein
MMDNANPPNLAPSGSKVKKVWWSVGLLVLALSVVAGFVTHMHPHFEIDALPAFNAWFSFLACVVMVGLAKVLGRLLTRQDTYYGDDHG